MWSAHIDAFGTTRVREEIGDYKDCKLAELGRGAAHSGGGRVGFWNPCPSAPLSTLNPVGVQLRLVVTGVRRAIPRRIHGVRLAITSMARSERRIAVRRPGVGIDASSAPADPARAASRATAKSWQGPGTPRSSTLARSSKPVPEPTTKSRT